MSLNFARFRKPSRYIGNEVNIVPRDGNVKVALCFPDTYEIGMSHVGLKILYTIINNIPSASAERVFAPWIDFESYIRQHDIPLASLEFQRPLSEFNIVGFTLQYELSYTNILNMLDLGGIPLNSEDRGDDFPLIIAGGPCAVNPLPLAPFIDAFVIGDGEEIIKEIVDVYSGAGDKNDLLNALAELEGVYVPSVHDRSKKRIKRRFVEDLDQAVFPDSPVLPYTPLVHDRVAVEVARGCTRGCRFCQAGMIYRPLRERSPENVLSLAQTSLANTGYDEVSFISLSTGDYSSLLPLIKSFNKECAGSHISVSLPSLRVASINSDVLKEIKSVRKTGFTIAPEAGTGRLRDVINKDLTDEEYEATLEKVFKEGWKKIKLYFMIGLPTETMEDIDSLINMAIFAQKKGRQIAGRRMDINVGISALVPKPHTPFQWEGQDSMAALREKQDYIKKAFRKRGIHFKGQYVENSLMEAVFSRADKKCSELLLKAWELGCRFDAWSEHFNFDKWIEASEKTGINLHEYASRNFDLDDELPWDFIDTGITKGFLKSEYKKAMNEKTTPDCRESCYGCGLECKDRNQKSEVRSQEKDKDSPGPGFRGSDKIKVPGRLRVRFSKTGEMRYLSHRELITALFRAMKRASVPLAYSSGFHPHPKISLGPALAAGVEGLNEFFDIVINSVIDPGRFKTRLNIELPEGLTILNAALIPVSEPSLNDMFSMYQYEIQIDDELKKQITSFIKTENCLISRKKKKVDIRPMVKNAEIKGNILDLTLTDTEEANARLHEILGEMLQLTSEEVQSLIIKRISLYGYTNKANQKSLVRNG
ncbi:MAG: TIGR03960 family B12-binding radical SAM protein [Nitrospirota bacterium]